MSDDIHHALVLTLHQPAGNLDKLLDAGSWQASEILYALDRIPRALWRHEDTARLHLSQSGTPAGDAECAGLPYAGTGRAQATTSKSATPRQCLR